MNDRIIESRNLPAWTAAAFAVAVIALALSFTALYRFKQLTALTHTEVVMLAQRVDSLQRQLAASPAAAPATALAPVVAGEAGATKKE
ncbi:MAG: hypothetical protein HY854_16390 [Burkholderiales bacterium]|nr:hypothetical protein [Burkholderiales bacterium]